MPWEDCLEERRNPPKGVTLREGPWRPGLLEPHTLQPLPSEFPKVIPVFNSSKFVAARLSAVRLPGSPVSRPCFFFPFGGKGDHQISAKEPPKSSDNRGREKGIHSPGPKREQAMLQYYKLFITPSRAILCCRSW